MARQKPPDLDESGQPIKSVVQPISVKPPDLDDIGVPIQSGITEPEIIEPEIIEPEIPEPEVIEQLVLPKEESFLNKAWKGISEPLTDLPSRVASSVAGYIDKPQLPSEYFDPESNLGSIEQLGNRLAAMNRGFSAGATQSIGDILTSLTSPLNLGTALLSGGTSLAARAGLPAIAKVLNLGIKAGGAGMGLHGLGEIISPESSLGERGFGVAEIAGGLAGIRSKVPQIGKSITNITNEMIDSAKPIAPMSTLNPILKPKMSSIQPTKITLPRDLQGAKPRFNIGQNSYEPKFESDIDRALYIIAQKNLSKRHNDYLNFVMKHTGLNEIEAINEGIKIKSILKNQLKGQEPGQIKISSIYNKSLVTPITSTSISDNITSIPVEKQSLPIGTTIYLKQPTVVNVKKAREAGYKFVEVMDDGRFRMDKVDEGITQPILETEIGQTRPTRKQSLIKPPNMDLPLNELPLEHIGPATKPPTKLSIAAETMNFPRAVMASNDFSAPLRQGLPLIHKKQFWTSLDDMFKSWGSENAFRAVQESIFEKPLFKSRVGPSGKILPSFAEDAGLKLTDLTNLSSREEALMSTWAEKLPGVRRSNRAYTAFLNKLRADVFEDLVSSSKVFGADAEVNIPLARELANFVNVSSGRGSLGSLEKSAVALNSTFFSPRLIASRLQMLNPHYYIMADPIVRKEALKSLFAVAAVGNTVGQLVKMSGAGTIESNSTSSDFGKIRVGNIRIDPFGGFQQYVVAANRLVQGKTKSSVTGSEYKLGEKFGRPTRLDVIGRFGESKLNPVISFVTGILRGKDFTGQPFNIPEEIASRFVSIFFQDLKQLITGNSNLIPNAKNYLREFHPENLPFALPSMFGAGIQNYESRRP